MRWAFKIAYIGADFHGFQRQPGLRTVEGEILGSLQAAGAIDSLRDCQFQSASRTDRGVSALGNVIAVNTLMHPKELISSVNRGLRDIWFHAYASVEQGFHPRKAERRWYRYHLRPDLNSAKLSEGSRIFLGAHDFRGFSRGEGGVCHIESVQFLDLGEWLALDIKADRFLWEMVRRIARGLELFSEGGISLRDLRDAMKGRDVGLEPAPPEYLWLMDVGYHFGFSPSLERSLSRDLRTLAEMKAMQSAFLRHLIGDYC